MPARIFDFASRFANGMYRARAFLFPLYMTLFAFVVVHEMWVATWNSGVPRAWDGTGHYGAAQIYDRDIFPDTFGWIGNYFGGMPFPNFYPPLFFWAVSLLHHTHLLSLVTSFKVLMLGPILLMPAFIWLLAWHVSEKNYHVAFWASFLSLFQLIDPRFGGNLIWSSGLDYFSTFAIGMYTQPLGFVLLILWYIVYLKSHLQLWRFTLASIMLALACLANYLNGVTAGLVVAVTLVIDGVRWRRASTLDQPERGSARRTFLAHAISPLVSGGLALFWLFPMFSTYDYLVTRPFTQVVFTLAMKFWYLCAVVGVLCWLRRPSRPMTVYLIVCLALVTILILASGIAPSWYPLQANRFSPTLNFFLAVPVGYVAAAIVENFFKLLVRLIPRLGSREQQIKRYFVGGFLILLFVTGAGLSQLWEMKVLVESQMPLAFYPPEESVPSLAELQPLPERSTAEATKTLSQMPPSHVDRQEILRLYQNDHKNDDAVVTKAAAEVHAILDFAHAHRDGRYLVEFPNLFTTGAGAYDSRAINSYLGVQGNETLTVVFREATPSSLFMYPQVNALSYNPDNFGMSSTLADDLDFAQQPLSRHLERASFLGVRYLVIYTPKTKKRLEEESSYIGAKYEFGTWTIFELKNPPPAQIRRLQFRPALLVSDFTVKLRRSDAPNYIRFVEEQFTDGWFDVLLVRAPQTKLDNLGSLPALEQFGAIILDRYECERCEFVYQQLHDFAQQRPLIMLSDNSHLFNRIKASIDDFPQAVIIERPAGSASGSWLQDLWPTQHYEATPLRRQWAQIRSVLEAHKVPVGDASVAGRVDQQGIWIDYDGQSPGSPQSIPVLIGTSFHPNWQNQNGDPVYAVTPMFMLSFVNGPTHLTFGRSTLDYASLWISALVLFALLGSTVWYYRTRQLAARGKAVRLRPVLAFQRLLE
jgi:hypothetical protein